MDGTLPDRLSDLLINESYQGTFGPAATWHAIDHDHVAAVSFRKHQADLLEALSAGATSFDITCMDLMMAVYRGHQRAVLLLGISPETGHQFSDLESLIKSSGWEERLGAKIYIQLVRPVLHSAPNRLISPGQALSVEDRPESHGTYGGPIHLGGELYALTCHHVIYDENVYPELRKIPEGELEKSTYVPSRRKYEMAKRQEDVEAAEKRLEIFEKDVSGGVCAGNSEQEKARIEQGLRLSVEMAEASLSQEPFEKWRIGTVAYDCGGLTTAGWKGHKRMVDWMLVRLERSVGARATVEVPKAIREAGSGAEVAIRGLFPDGHCDYTALRCHVYKHGQKTLLTEGRLNGRTDSPPYRTYIADRRQIFKEIHRVTKMVPSIPNGESSAPGLSMDLVTLAHCFFSPDTPKIKLLSEGCAVVNEQVATLEAWSQNYVGSSASRLETSLLCSFSAE